MTVAWPASLPFCPIPDSYREAAPRGQVEPFETDTGPGKRRRISTAAPRTIEFTLPSMTAAEFAVFEDWFDQSLSGGAVAFEALHPRRRTLANFQFVVGSEYEIERKGANGWFVSIALLELPS